MVNLKSKVSYESEETISECFYSKKSSWKVMKMIPRHPLS